MNVVVPYYIYLLFISSFRFLFVHPPMQKKTRYTYFGRLWQISLGDALALCILKTRNEVPYCLNGYQLGNICVWLKLNNYSVWPIKVFSQQRIYFHLVSFALLVSFSSFVANFLFIPHWIYVFLRRIPNKQQISHLKEQNPDENIYWVYI